MSRWTKDVLRQVRPHFIIQSIKDPKRAFREIKFRYTFTSKSRFTSDILSLSRSPFEVLDESKQRNFSSSLKSQITRSSISSGRGPMGDEAELLYICVRLMKPAFVVETGVGAGFSTACILKALKRNNFGMLYSIDLFKDDETCGWIIPNQLKKRWRLIKGSSANHLNPLLSQLGLIDIFIHDSDHSYENMISEFRRVWPHLKKGGIFMAHDVGRNDALFDFLKEIQFPWWRVRTYKWLAGFQKPLRKKESIVYGKNFIR